MLHSVHDVQHMISEGRSLILAGSEEALSQLPKGNWIGGSIPYFIDLEGGVCDEKRIFVTDIPRSAVSTKICEYVTEELQQMYADAPGNGYSFLILPYGVPVHQAFAERAPSFEGFLFKPVVGWVAGVALTRLSEQKPCTFDGAKGTKSYDKAVVMHVTLPEKLFADLDIVNIFRPASQSSITFPQSGFSATECLLNGETVNLARYIAEKKVDTRLPLIANYSGSLINVSLKQIDTDAGKVDFYAPVFKGITYHFAAPVGDYAGAFLNATSHAEEKNAAFTCNCILNYVHGGLEGKKTGFYGPMTFGEVAHQLLNQTRVQLRIHDLSGS
jgi:hypothetical protein